jgi:hypothetical protein
MRQLIALTAVMVGSTACGSTINTLPPVADPAARPQEVTLQIPEGFDIQSVSYSATMYPNVSGTSGTYGVTTTTAGGRAFVQVLAVDRNSGEQVLLLYENVAQRAHPIQIIRFRSGAESGAIPE